ncbi:MAG: cytochrome d ubiquinol oxidase subunit II [Terriglobales bacterium]
MWIEISIAFILMSALTLYALYGGADYGGGVWDLLSLGPHKEDQRNLIAEAIGPVWEANHVWLVLVVVILFTAFPSAFSRLTVALHVPLVLMLIGIVLRGCAFTFRTYHSSSDRFQKHWGRIFAMASIATPVFLGTVIGAIFSGRAEIQNGLPVYGFIGSWLAPFPLAVGAFALALFSWLAATYLIVEADEPPLTEIFRRKALWSGAVAVATGAIVLGLGLQGNVKLGGQFAHWGWIFMAVSALLTASCFGSLTSRKFRLARFLISAQVVFVLWGWAGSQFPFLIMPNLTLYSAAAPRSTMLPLLVALVVGGLLLLPSVYYLFIVFKGRMLGLTRGKQPAPRLTEH